MRYVVLAVVGICAGALVAGGLFTVLLSVGLIPRFAGKTHTNRKVFLYEEMVILGAVAGIIFSVFPGCQTWGEAARSFLPGGMWEVCGTVLLAVYGIFAGIFVGALALAIAEMLDSIPIFTRRIGFRHGLGIVILAMAFGKMCGSLYYFAHGWAAVVK
ncbi:MAG: stage V sporulation protein AB [Lachnospiraceae bacterium]|nr:stage V sporulation protein AB [Lachnospiraceae bacterium]